MATRILQQDGNHAKSEKPSRRRNEERWAITDLEPAPRHRFIRDNLEPRIILFPPGIIEEHDRKPGQLIDLVTLALSKLLKPGEAVKGVVSKERPSSAITWTRTCSGEAVDLLNPDPKNLRIEDIAKALSKVCRFAGHTRKFYSVAQHSVIVSRLCPPELRLKGLLHDAAEAFVSDIPTPVKSILSAACRAELKAVEARLLAALGKALAIDVSPDPAVKHADLVALRHEAELLLPEPIAGFADLPGDPCEPITPWRAEVAERNFLHEFHRLVDERKHARRHRGEF